MTKCFNKGFLVLCLLVLFGITSIAIPYELSLSPFFSTPFDVVKESPKIYTRHIVRVNDTGFTPEVLTISRGATIEWRNERKKLPFLLLGVREIVSMKSSVVNPKESFIWTFENNGTFTYVDGVILGQSGKVIVE
jgi:plastocyanin